MMKIEFERDKVYTLEQEENGEARYVIPDFSCDAKSVQLIHLTAKEAAQMIQDLRVAYIALEKKAERMEAVIIEDIARREGKCKDAGKVPPKPVGPPNQRIRECDDHDRRVNP